MARIKMPIGATQVVLAARAKPKWIPPALLQAPGGLYPMLSAAYEVDEYRLDAGWPVAVPDIDIRIHVLASCDGEVLAQRDDPLSLQTNADFRWVADSNYWDPVAFQWTAMSGDVSPWVADPAEAPTLYPTYQYTVGNERFTDVTVLNFDSDTNDFLTNDFSEVMGGVMGYTVIMVLNPNSIYGNDPNIVSNALWSPDSLSGAYAAFTIQDQAVYLNTETGAPQKGPSIGDSLADTAPMYLALVVNRPQTTIYAGPGTSSIRSKGLVAGTAPESLSTQFWLGNSPLSGAGSMDMALMDLGVYANPLTKAEVLAEFATLSGSYGGNK